ncbi:MAG: hypothetical protein C4346_08105 [Chloroflexota bacterium]
MAARERTTAAATVDVQARAAELARSEPVGGVPGPGRWLVARYAPVALFSLKISMATSSVGRTLVVPTPYAIKMALVDAGFRAGLTDAECAALLRALVPVSVRIAPPETAVVTHTFVKIRQEPKTPDPLRPYVSSIAYRELVHHRGEWRWAFDLATGDASLAERLVYLAPHVIYVGKRGSFVQFLGLERVSQLGEDFTQPVEGAFLSPPRAHIVPLDDFGPQADLETLSSYSDRGARRERHRRFVNTIVPLGIVNTGPGFTVYARG